jgi:hypothetical protein
MTTYNKIEFEAAVEFLTKNNRFNKGDRKWAIQTVNYVLQKAGACPELHFVSTGGVTALNEDDHISLCVSPSIDQDHTDESYVTLKLDKISEETKKTETDSRQNLKLKLEECYIEADKLFNKLTTLLNEELKEYIDEHHLASLKSIKDKGFFEIPSFIQSVATATSLAAETMAQVDGLCYKLEQGKDY